MPAAQEVVEQIAREGLLEFRFQPVGQPAEDLCLLVNLKPMQHKRADQHLAAGVDDAPVAADLHRAQMSCSSQKPVDIEFRRSL